MCTTQPSIYLSNTTFAILSIYPYFILDNSGAERPRTIAGNAVKTAVPTAAIAITAAIVGSMLIINARRLVPSVPMMR